MRRKTGFPGHINVIAQKDFARASCVLVVTLTKVGHAQSGAERGEGVVGGWGLRWAESGHSLEEGGAFWQTDRQAGRRGGLGEFGLKRPTVCFGRRRGIRSGDRGLFFCGPLAFSAFYPTSGTNRGSLTPSSKRINDRLWCFPRTMRETLTMKFAWKTKMVN